MMKYHLLSVCLILLSDPDLLSFLSSIPQTGHCDDETIVNEETSSFDEFVLLMGRISCLVDWEGVAFTIGKYKLVLFLSSLLNH